MKLFKRNSAAKPSPIVVPPTTKFEGNDGSWSTFYINVGYPTGQNFRVLVSTSSVLTWVIAPQGCTSSDPSDCPELRGVEDYAGAKSSGYNPSDSVNATTMGDYALAVDGATATLSSLYGPRYSGINVAVYDDVVGLGEYSTGSLRLTEVFGAVASTDIFLGEFGLGITGFGFGSGDYSTFLDLLPHCSMPIPSLSYGYTAGASYREGNYYGNLVLGGYDASRFTLPDHSYPMLALPNDTLITYVKSIIIDTSTNQQSATADAQGYAYTFSARIDSTFPYLSLPDEVVSRFVDIFGLTYDTETDLYTINATQRASNLNNKPVITITIAETATSPNTTQITLPYEAFDQTASWPIYNSSTPYFPIRNSHTGIFVLGRTILQESYLVVDYERRNWLLGTPNWTTAMPTADIVPIYSPHGGGSSVKAGVIAGAVVAAVAVLATIVTAYICFRRRSKQRPAAAVSSVFSPATVHPLQGFYGPEGTPKSPASELASTEVHAKDWIESPTPGHSRGPSDGSYELESEEQALPAELPANSSTPPLVRHEADSPVPDAHDRLMSTIAGERRRSSDNMVRRMLRRQLTVVRESEVSDEDENEMERISRLSLAAAMETEESKEQSVIVCDEI